MSQDPALEARYGRTPGRRRGARVLAVVAGAGVLAAVVVWVIWVGLLGPASSLEARTLGFSLQGDTAVEVSYEITVEPGRTVSCAVEALNTDFGIVGWKVVAIPAADRSTRRFSEVLRTTEPPVTGLIYRCWLT